MRSRGKGKLPQEHYAIYYFNSIQIFFLKILILGIFVVVEGLK